MNSPAALVWLRRDLRLADNAALHAALTASRRVYCGFVFDTEILDALPVREDRRVEFIRESLVALEERLAGHGASLVVRHGRARDELPRLAAELAVAAVYANHDHEPAARARDAAVAKALDALGIAFHTRKDQTIFERDEVLSGEGRPYSVFTAYKNAWLKKLDAFQLKSYPVERHLANLAPLPRTPVPELGAIGFRATGLAALGVRPGEAGARALLKDFTARIDRYREARDFPAVKGPSYLSVHLRFGTVSIRELARFAQARASIGAQTWLSELIWRDFYFMILWHHPHVVARAFKPQFDAVAWPNDPARLAAWRAGLTGYPLVDAAMRQLDRSGYMHNRLRMVAASFLVKDLHCDWRLGERWFAERLLDFDLAANNGGWQWAASTGCDAQPWFRIFNPVTQSQRFDPQGRFIRRYVPELAGFDDRAIHAPWLADAQAQARAGCVIGRDYPAPIVDHAEARRVALALFGQAAPRDRAG